MPLAVSALILVGILLLIGLYVGIRARPEIIERHRTEDRQKSIRNQIGAASQWLADLSCELGTEKLTTQAMKVLDSLFYCIPQTLASSSQYHRIALFIIDDNSPENIHLKVFRHAGFDSDAYTDSLRLPINGSIAGLSYRTKQAYRTGDIEQDDNWLKIENDPQKYCSLMCAPAVAGGQVLGVLSIDSTEKSAFTDDDELSLGIFARQVAVILSLLDKQTVLKENQKRENTSKVVVVDEEEATQNGDKE
jgi:GAF domain-containing protein